jgi:hypothetical protein
MADYYTPTVVQQVIPDAEMTSLEKLLLARIFESERIDDGWYFFAEAHPEEIVDATRGELEQARVSSSDMDTTLHRCVREQLADADPDMTEITLDFTGTSWEVFFQDIVKRSKTLRYITAVAAFTCTKMRPDAFGGMATLITRDTILGKSTHEILGEFLAGTGLDGSPEAEIPEVGAVFTLIG